MRKIAVVALVLFVSTAAWSGAEEIEATVGVQGLTALPAETTEVRPVPDRSPDGPPLSEEDLRHLRRLENLRELDLRGAGRQAGPHGVGGSRWDLHLTDAGLAIMAEIHSLEHLTLPDCPDITDAGLARLAESLPRLSSLTLRYWGAFGQKNPSRLTALPAFVRLEVLDLSGSRGENDESWPEQLAAVPNLSSLTLEDCPWVARGGVIPLLEGGGITRLTLGPVDDGDLEPFRSRPTPYELQLRNCPHLSSKGLAALAADGRLRRLEMERCFRLVSLAPLSGHPGLATLVIRNARSLTSEGFSALGSPPALTRLRLAGCPKLDESVLADISKLPNLTHLDLSAERFQGTPQRYGRIPVTDAGLSHLLKLEKLEFLDLSGMRFTIYGPAPEPVEIYEPCLVTDAGLKVLAKLRSLRCLRIRECPGITDEGVAALREALPECRVER